MTNISPRFKPSSILRFASLVLVTAFFAACGGGGSDQPAQPSAHPPQISDLSYAPASAQQAVGGKATIRGSAKFSDAGGDVVALGLTTSSGQTLSSPLPQAQGVTAGVVAGEVLVSLDVAGTYTFEMWVTDSSGLASNRLRGTFEVVAQGQPQPPPAAALTAIGVNPPGSSVAKGFTQRFLATGAFSDGSTRDITATVEWSSSDPAIATIDASGLVRCVSIGSATIQARSGSVVGTAVLTVSPAVLTSIGVTPAAKTLWLGENEPYAALGTFSDGTTSDVTQSVTWSSSDPAVLRINNSPGRIGVANTRGPGSTLVSASSGTVTGKTAVTVMRRDPWVLFAASVATNNIAAFSVNSTTGTLSQIPGSPFPSTAGSTSIALARTMPLLFSANFGAGTVSGFWIDWDGALVPVAGSPFAAGNGPVSVVAHPTANFIYVTNQGDGDVVTLAVDPANGALSRKSSVTIGFSPMFAGMTYDGKRFYQTVSSMNQVAGFSASAADGALTPVPGASASTATYPRALAIDPSGKFLYAAVSSGTTVYGFSIDGVSGVLTPIPGSPVASLSDPVSLAVDASGRFLVVANRTPPGSLSVFAIDHGSGALFEVAGSPFASIWPIVVTTDPSGQYVYVGGDAGLQAFAMDPLTGALTPLAAYPGNNIWSIAISF